MVQDAFGELAFGRAYVFRLFKEFKDGREDIESGAGKTLKPRVRTEDNVDKIRDLVAAN